MTEDILQELEWIKESLPESGDYILEFILAMLVNIRAQTTGREK